MANTLLWSAVLGTIGAVTGCFMAEGSVSDVEKDNHEFNQEGD